VKLSLRLLLWIKVRAIRRLNRKHKKSSIILVSQALASIMQQCSYKSNRSRLSKRNYRSSLWEFMGQVL